MPFLVETCIRNLPKIKCTVEVNCFLYIKYDFPTRVSLLIFFLKLVVLLITFYKTASLAC